MRDSERLKKIFGSQDLGRLKGRIVRREPGGIYVIETDTGAHHRAESEADYTVGSRVTLFQGRILGYAAGGKSTKVFDL